MGNAWGADNAMPVTRLFLNNNRVQKNENLRPAHGSKNIICLLKSNVGISIPPG
jgi:hypothetical protein